jgi:hypothetical protein
MKLSNEELRKIIIQEIKALRAELPPMKLIRIPAAEEEVEMINKFLEISNKDPEQSLMLADALSLDALKYAKRQMDANLIPLRKQVDVSRRMMNNYADEENPERFGPLSFYEDAYEAAKNKLQNYKDFLKQMEELINDRQSGG